MKVLMVKHNWSVKLIQQGKDVIIYLQLFKLGHDMLL